MGGDAMSLPTMLMLVPACLCFSTLTVNGKVGDLCGGEGRSTCSGSQEFCRSGYCKEIKNLKLGCDDDSNCPDGYECFQRNCIIWMTDIVREQMMKERMHIKQAMKLEEERLRKKA